MNIRELTLWLQHPKNSCEDINKLVNSEVVIKTATGLTGEIAEMVYCERENGEGVVEILLIRKEEANE